MTRQPRSSRSWRVDRAGSSFQFLTSPGSASATSRVEKIARFGLWCIWPVTVTIALGATLDSITHADQLTAMFDNKLMPDQRLVGLGYFAGSLVVVGGFARALRLRTAI